MMRLCVVGFGLIGGSLALAARAARFASHVTAVDIPQVLGTEAARRAADVCIDVADEGELARAVSEAEMTVLAAPVGAICESVEWVLGRAHVVTDCGSTKRRIVECAGRSPRAARFVPGHPMTGQPSGGVQSARADLFAGSAWLLCPQGRDPQAVAAVEHLVTALGARSIHLTPEEHDAAVARTSHLPQLLASALLVLAGQSAARGAAGPAFERATRAAGGPSAVWRDIFTSNGDEVARAIRELLGALEPLAAELEARGDTRATEALLERARRYRS